ncbi:MAG: ABC transporter permease [Chitinophagaceae bacterium]
MVKSFIKTAWRNIKKYRTYSLINILGLAIGIACCLLIMLFVTDELSYDRFNKKADRIYRVVHFADWPGNSLKLAPTSAPFAPALKKDYAEIEQTVRFVLEGGGSLKIGEKKLETEEILFVDASVFQVFSFPLLYGDSATALSQPDCIVLSESMAAKLFSNPEAAIGQVITIDDKVQNKVTGIVKDVPANSHIRFQALRSMPANYTTGWQNFQLYTYVLLTPSADKKKLESKLGGFYNKYLKSEMGQLNYRMELQPLTSIHLHSNLDYEISANGNIRYVYIFSVIAIVILLIACINYMNLATARATLRVREIGVRKTIGSDRKQIAGLFFSESILLTLVATILGAYLATLLLPWFNAFTGKELRLFNYGPAIGIAILFVFAIVTGLLAGMYPALFMSGFNIISSLRGYLGKMQGTALFRKSLVTFQFVIAIVLIAVSITTYYQMRYTMRKDLGFNKEQVLTFHINKRELRKNIPAIKARFLQSPFIESVAIASNPIGNNNIGSAGYFFEKDGKISDASQLAQNFMIDQDFVPAMQIKMAAGRNFSADMPSDKYNSVLVNEALVKELGWKDAVGKRVKFLIDDKGNTGESRIIGVVKDFHIYSLQHKIEPLVLHMPPVDEEQDNLYVRVGKGHTAEAISFLTTAYREFDNTNSPEIHFLDQNFARQYHTEQKQGQLFLVFTILAVFIACLGLFGLAAFMADQRTKEIGIRKVLGASVYDLVQLLSGDFLKLVILAAAIALPLAWWAISQWLQEFAYRVPVSWWIFGLAGVLAFVIALLTVSVQAFRSARANPVQSLRSE